MSNNHFKSRSFPEFLNEEMAIKNFNSEKLSTLCGIPARYIDALKTGNFKTLPAAPYVRGYLLKIAAVLSVNGEELWRLYKKEAEALKILEPVSTLPQNRFALKKINKRSAAFAVLAILVLIYLGFRAKDFLGIPTLSLDIPFENLVVAESPLIVKGSVSDRDSLTINGERVKLDENGLFEKSVNLDVGLNNIEFKVKKFLGRELVVVKQVFYQPQ